LKIAAVGGHNLLMIGLPGAGKSMLAERMKSILSELSAAEALSITMIHSINGTLPEQGLFLIGHLEIPITLLRWHL